MARGAVVRANGSRLLRERHRRHLTQIKAAVAIGISPITLARAESGELIRPKVLEQLASFYELDLGKITDRAS